MPKATNAPCIKPIAESKKRFYEGINLELRGEVLADNCLKFMETSSQLDNVLKEV